MSGLSAVMDAYDRRARFYPMVIVLLPALLGGACWLPSGIEFRGLIGGAVITLAVSAFLTQLARDQGKRREKELFRLWGGRPSDRALSYSGLMFADATLARCHKKLMTLDPGLKLPPSKEYEKEHPTESKAGYAAATDLLVARTRDKEKFSLLFKENVSYGFRRNLWGMKIHGIIVSVLGLGASIGKLAALAPTSSPVDTAALLSCGISGCLLVIWCARVTPSWVRTAADGYAKQLAAACDSL
jgi:hypothetical protein